MYIFNNLQNATSLTSGLHHYMKLPTELKLRWGVISFVLFCRLSVFVGSALHVCLRDFSVVH